jgi:hypothetical protein
MDNNTPFVLISFSTKHVEVGVDTPSDVLEAIARVFGGEGIWKDGGITTGKTYHVRSQMLIAVNHSPRIAYQMEQLGYTLCFGASPANGGLGLSMMFRLKETPK